MKNLLWKFAFPAVILVLIDQLVKLWVRQNVVLGQSLGVPFPGIFEIKLAYNYGIAFGLLEGRGVLFAPVAVAIAGYAIYWCIKNPEESALTFVTVGMLVAGAIGNLIDRVVDGRVTDMFWFRLINFPVFNVADACITISAILLFIRSLKSNDVKEGDSKLAAVDLSNAKSQENAQENGPDGVKETAKTN